MNIDLVYAAKHLAILHLIEKQYRISNALMMWAVSKAVNEAVNEADTTRDQATGQVRGQIISARQAEARMMRFIKGMITVTWSCILFIFTCTHNLEAFMFHERTQFR